VALLALLSPFLFLSASLLVVGVNSLPSFLLPSRKIPLLLAGIAVYTLFRCGGVRVERAHVWGHELVHLVSAKAFGRKVRDFDVSSSGRSGFVVVENPNVWVFVAPYVFSFYGIVAWAAALALRGRAWWLPDAYLFTASFLFAMNLEFAVRGFLQHQPDLEVSGRLFSGSLVLLCIVLWIPAMLFPASSAGWRDLVYAYARWVSTSMAILRI